MLKYKKTIENLLHKGDINDKSYRDATYDKFRQALLRAAHKENLSQERIFDYQQKLEDDIQAIENEIEQFSPQISSKSAFEYEQQSTVPSKSKSMMKPFMLAGLAAAALGALWLLAPQFTTGGSLGSSTPSSEPKEVLFIETGTIISEAGDASISKGNSSYLVIDNSAQDTQNYRWVVKDEIAAPNTNLTIEIDRRDASDRLAQIVVSYKAKNGKPTVHNYLIDFADNIVTTKSTNGESEASLKVGKTTLTLNASLKQLPKDTTIVLYLQPAVGSTKTASLNVQQIRMEVNLINQ